MFIVFNKQKIYSYIIALMTVFVLFGGAALLGVGKLDTIETAATTEKLIPIYSVETNDKNIALTIMLACLCMPVTIDTARHNFKESGSRPL